MTARGDYRRSRKLATIEHLGRTFHVVRRKYDGKPWRGYLTLVYEGTAMSVDYAKVDDPSDVETSRAYWARALQRFFPDTPEGRKSMDEVIAYCIEKNGRVEP